MHRDIAYYMSLPYTIEVIPDDGDGLWFAEVKELPGCMTQAESWDALYPLIRDAMEGWLNVALEFGHPIPEPESHISLP
jgi:antitoxin HicB